MILFRPLFSKANKFKSINRFHHQSSTLKKEETLVKYLGQPTADTHPHLIKPGFVLPGITSQELWTRRQKLSQMIQDNTRKKHCNVGSHLIVIPSATKSYMSEKIPYVFRQNTDFLYFSGCQEPDTCLVIEINDSSDEHRSVLFVRNEDKHGEMWDGPRTSPSDATKLFGVTKSLPIDELENYMDSFCKEKETLMWFDNGQVQPNVADVLQQHLKKGNRKVWDSPKNLIHQIRVIKSAAEIELMKQSCDIASQAIAKCMQVSKPEITEHELFATVDYQCRKLGAEYLAYPPVVAGGPRATIIHYINNNQVVKDGEMVLMDAGCEYHGYTSDITRTWPINGTFSNEQKELYEAVLDVQQHVISLLCKPTTLDKLFDSMCLILGKRLQETGLVGKTNNVDTIMRQSYQFCPHHVSHYLGMDVHDTAAVPRSTPLVPGMVITVEPGVYINRTMNVPGKYHGIGIRIEDDVLITEDGPLVLTSKCPKFVSDIENVCAYVDHQM